MDFKFIGWCREGTSDKVWGVIYLCNPNDCWRGKCLTFWGRRGRKLQTKVVDNDRDLSKLIDGKKHKGYVPVNTDKLNQVYPEFRDDLEKTAMWALLSATN